MTTCYPLIVNKSHHVGNNVFTYKFGKNVDFSQKEIALGSVSLFYSWRNITALKGNNTFTILHPGATTTNDTLDITIPDSGMEIADLNNFLRWKLITLGYYIQNTASLEQKVYCEFRVNKSTYSIDFVTYPVDTTLPTGWTAGSALVLPSTTRTPQLVIGDSFGQLIGFEAGTWPAVQPIILTTIESTKVPVLSDVINVLLTCDAVLNPYTPSSYVIHSISPANQEYGHLISESPNELSFIPCQQCNRQEITLTFTNQNLEPLNLIDYDITIKLLLRDVN